MFESHEGSLPFLLRFTQRVEPFPAPGEEYDPVLQRSRVPAILAGKTQYTRSIQRGTTSWSAGAIYEDYDEEYKTTTD
ncbi:MAG: hypothetical protein ABIG71_04080 [Candidatus Uhrbacteria bacterium]